MSVADEFIFERTDIWHEGKWIDLWSVVHLLSGTSVGLGFYFFHLGIPASVLLALLSFVAYEMWEALVKIEETPTNRFMDVILGMTGFLPAFFIFAPTLQITSLVFLFGFVFTINVVMSIFGWQASQKAAILQKRVHKQYDIRRAKLLERGARLRRRLHRK